MRFLIDLIWWFLTGNGPEQFEPETVAEAAVAIEAPTKKAVFDIKREADPEAFLDDLRSLRPITEQFERAREELLHELQRLAPPRRSRHIRKDAA